MKILIASIFFGENHKFNLPETIIPPILGEINGDVHQFMISYNSKRTSYKLRLHIWIPISLFLIGCAFGAIWFVTRDDEPILILPRLFGFCFGWTFTFLICYAVFNVWFGPFGSSKYHLILRHKYNQKCKIFLDTISGTKI